MLCNHRHLVLIYYCLHLCLPLTSSAGPKQLSIDEILERALIESPVVKRIEQRTAEQRALGLSISTMENPILDTEVKVPSSYRDSRGSDEVLVSVSQPLRASDFGIRSRVNALLQNAADNEQRSAILELSQKVRLSYVKTWAVENQEEKVREFLTRSKALESAVKKASESGYLGGGESHLLKADAVKARLQLQALSADAKRSRAELWRTAGFVDERPLAPLSNSALPKLAELLSHNSEISGSTRANLAVKLAAEQDRLAALDAYPKFTPRLVFERTGDYTNYFGVGLSVELPFYSRNPGEKLARAAELSATQRTATYFASEGYRMEISALHESITANTSLLVGYKAEVIPALRQALSAEEELLSSGQGSFLRVWQTIRELGLAESELVDRTLRVQAERSELAVLTGSDL